MSLKGYFTDLISLQAPGTSDQQQALSDSLDAKNLAIHQAYVQQQVDSGAFTADQGLAYNETMAADYSQNRVDVNAQVGGAFVDGLKEGAASEAALATSASEGVNKALSFSLKTVFGAIPISVWFIGGLVLFFWMGGLSLLKGRLAKT